MINYLKARGFHPPHEYLSIEPLLSRKELFVIRMERRLNTSRPYLVQSSSAASIFIKLINTGPSGAIPGALVFDAIRARDNKSATRALLQPALDQNRIDIAFTRASKPLSSVIIPKRRKKVEFNYLKYIKIKKFPKQENRKWNIFNRETGIWVFLDNLSYLVDFFCLLLSHYRRENYGRALFAH